MARIWGFDIGTTSIGWAAIEYDVTGAIGRVLGMGVRIFPEARDPDGTPLNQTRRQKRMARRQLRRRRERRKALNRMLADAGLLPPFSKDKDSEWARIMSLPPLSIRARALTKRIEPYELGRALYHLAKHRHFKGRDLDESDTPEAADADEKAASNAREQTTADLKATGKTLGETLAANFPVQGDRERNIRGAVPRKRTRGVHALRAHVADEFERLWAAQAAHHPSLTDTLKAHVGDVIFTQKPVFWRKSTLGQCRLMPGEELAPKGSWLSQQRRMLEKLNNLEVASGNRRPLDAEERAAVLAKLQTQASMTWSGVRKALAPLCAARGEKGMEKRIRFNLELGGEPKLLGNPLEARLAVIFGESWETYPRRQAIRDAIHRRLWCADYGEVGTQRVVIRSAKERECRRADAAKSMINDFGVSEEQAEALAAIRLPTGWEPFSTKALEAILPELERGERFGTLMISPERAAWREATFPNRVAPTGEVLDRLPSPARKKLPDGRWDTSEEDRIKAIRNPTVARTQNELRKVVNNLIDAFGKPDLIRVELARDVGLSKREREERQAGIRKNNRRRTEAKKDLEANGILGPSARDIEKWVLWKEGDGRCPYTRDEIGFDALFRRGEFEVEHIWPRSRSLDDSQGNKTLCRKDINIAKGNRTPFEFFRNDPEGWKNIRDWMDGHTSSKGGSGFPRGKVKRFLAETMPDDFTSRQLTDTGYAARQAVTLLKRLWADVGEPNQAADFGIDEELRRRKVLPVAGRVTAHLRKLWGLNYILADDGEKTRADHRHHAIDALVVACADPSVTQRLSRYWQQKDDPREADPPPLLPPWPSIRADAERVVKDIVVSHRVRKKVSGPLHEETVRHPVRGSARLGSSDTILVARKPVEKLTPSLLANSEAIRDPHVRLILQEWIVEHGEDAKKAFEVYPTVSPDGPPIKKVRVGERRQLKLMVPAANGYADAGLNHHIAVYRNDAGKTEFEVVTLFEASRRISKRQSVVNRTRTGAAFVASFSLGETVELSADNAERTRWVVVGIEGDGRAALAPLNDARPGDAKAAKAAGFDAARTTFRPRIGGLMRRDPRKISVDPIGRVRPAND